MRLRILLLCVVLLPTLASAEIYKWKDSNGAIRYSDVPPPSNVKQEALYGKKIAKPTGLAPLAPVEGDVTTALNRDKAATLAKDKAASDKMNADKTKIEGKVKDEKTPPSKEEAAQKRAQDAEKQKQAEEQQKAELETKQANCIAAKQNLATYTNGGRIAKTDENGKKHYLGDADINQAKADAKKDVEKYCD